MEKRKVQVVLFNTQQDNKKNFLLLKTNEKRGSFWQNITGGVDKGEAFKAAALRESIEETGLAEDNIKNLTELNYAFDFTDRWGKVAHEEVFLLEVHQAWDITIDPSEHQDWKWVEQDALCAESVKFETNWKALEKVINS
jgi:8-oxo-dGTP pyrophosphatase MutT (NUDIX family)